MGDDEFVALQRHSDWGTEYWPLPGRGLSSYGCASVEYGIKFVAGDIMTLKWPDGSVAGEVIGFELEARKISDMGNDYEMTTGTLHVYRVINGVRTPIRITNEFKFLRSEIEPLHGSGGVR